MHQGHCLKATQATVLLTLAACGGGGSDTPAATTPTPTPAALVVSGTAATGAALAAGTVDAKCTTGTGTATTAADGSYTLSITGGALPCVLRVTAGATVLHGAATGSGASARANLTPVSELVLSQLTAGTAAGYFGSFGSSAAAGLTTAAVQTAATAVVDTLRSGGVDFSAAGDVMAGALVAANGSTAGNAYDRALDALKAQLTAAGTTLATLAQAVAAGSPAAPVATLSSTASLPADMLLKPAAANCASLRSSRYRAVLNEAADTAGSYATLVSTVDATKLTVTNSANQVQQLTATGPCAYTMPSLGEVVVTKAGVIAARLSSNGTVLKGAVLFPEQAHTMAELAGEWNAIAFDRTTDNGPVHLTSLTVGIDSGGKFTAINFCDDLRTCTATTAATLPNITHTVNSAGGFNQTNSTDNYTNRVFLYRAGGGELMQISLSSQGHIAFGTRKVSGTLPTLGRVTESWNLTLTAQYTAPFAVTTSKNTVVSLDTAGSTFVRNAVQNFTTGATRPETLQINSLRDGYFRRLPATNVLHSDGGTSNVTEFIGLTMRGMDLSVIAFPANSQLVLSPTISVVNP